MYLRSLCHEDPKQWLNLLPWAELWYNTNFHSPIGMSPYKALYGREPTTIPNYSEGNSNIEAVDVNLQLREEQLSLIKSSLEKTQFKMKESAE